MNYSFDCCCALNELDKSPNSNPEDNKFGCNLLIIKHNQQDMKMLGVMEKKRTTLVCREFPKVKNFKFANTSYLVLGKHVTFYNVFM